MLHELYQEIDSWFEGDEKERTAAQMLDLARSILANAGYDKEHADGCAALDCAHDPRPCDCDTA